METTQVPAGYKLTELGVLPDDWEVKRLDAIGSIIRGASPRPKGDPRYYGGNVPRLMVEDVTRDGKIVYPRIDFLTEAGAKLSRPCKKGTLTIVCSGTVGVVSFLGVDACIHDGFLALIDIKKNVADDYLYYQFERLRETFDASATHGGVFTNLTTSGVKEFIIPLPPLAEQQAIAEALGEMDALLAAQQARLAKQRAVKQGLLQGLLSGQQRLPGFAGEWEVKQLGDVTTVMTGNTPPTSNRSNYGSEFLFASPADLGTTKYITNTEKKLSSKGFSIARKFPAGSTLFTCIGSTIGKTGLSVSELTSNQQINACFPKEGLLPEYLYYILTFLAPVIKATASEQAVPLINKTDFSKTIIPVPSIDEQRAIAAVLSEADAYLAALEAEHAKTQLLKQGMMQNLLTGKLRLV
jgi:type I restriction enzyme S subunit